MVQRIALFTTSLVAALVIGLGLGLAGLAPASAPAAGDTAPVATVAAEPPAPTTQVDTVYVAAQPKPKEITVRKTVAAPHGDDEGEGEDD